MIVWRYERTVVFSKRLLVLGFFFFILFLILSGRLFYLQVLNGDKYMLLAEKNRISVRLTLPTRGSIYDRNGIKLAENKKTFQAVLIKEQAEDYKKTLDRFHQLLPFEENERARIEKLISQRRAFMPVQLKDNLTFDEVALLQINAPDLPGIVIEEGMNRYYGVGEACTHVVGYVSLLNDNDLDGDKENPLFDLPGYRMGRIGIEQAFEDQLKGKPGIRKTEVNAFGRSVRILEDIPPVPGTDIHLSIDSRLQKYGLKLFGKESGSLIVTDIETGEILALVSAPSFDPNLFTVPLSVKNWNALLHNPKTPLQNKAIAGQYSPGSIFKLPVALAGLENHVITGRSKITCDGRTKLGEQYFHCWKRRGHGAIDVVEALAHSCDVYFYETSQDIGVDHIVAIADKLGFGKPTGIELNGEKKGLLPSKLWKEQYRNDGWRMGDTLNLSIGQGFLNATPVQMVRMITLLLGDGTDKPLTLIKKDGESKIYNNLGFSASHLRLLRQGMDAVVNHQNGTAYGSRFIFHGHQMGGKTASTQVRRISLQEREEGIKSQDELPWKYRDHAMFVGFAPLKKPRYAIAVVVEHGGGGARIAAPIASKMLREILRLEAEDSQKVILNKGKQ